MWFYDLSFWRQGPKTWKRDQPAVGYPFYTLPGDFGKEKLQRFRQWPKRFLTEMPCINAPGGAGAFWELSSDS